MKKCILLFAIIICSCSGDDISPEQAENIVGTWKTEIVISDNYRTQAVWEIRKSGDNSVLIKMSRTVWPKIDSDEGQETYPELTINSARMSDKKTLVLEYNTAAIGADFCGIKGNGTLVGNKLTMVTSTVCKGKDPDPTTQEFTRQ